MWLKAFAPCRRSEWLLQFGRYLGAVGLCVLGWSARRALIGALPSEGFPFLTFFPAVILAAYFFGLGPGLVCAALSVAAAYASFIPRDADAFLGLATGDLIALIFFSCILVVDCLLLHLLARSQRLAAQRERDLREITNNTPDVLTRFDPAFRHLFISGAVERVTGKPSAHFIGKTNRELGMPPALCDTWDAALTAVFRDARPAALQFELGGLTFAVTLVPEFAESDGSVKSVLGVTRDVTELHRHQSALEAHDRQKDQMMATVAHELRTPISTVSSGIQLLERREALSSEGHRTLAAMRRQTAQMVRLVDDLMDLARIRANLLDLAQAPVNLCDLLRSAAEACGELQARKQVQVDLHLPAGGMGMRGDAGRLIQIFTNLLTNAIKFSTQGGRVAVTANTAGDTHTVCVADQGAGIEPDMLETVFHPFVQAPAGRSNQTGLGIGLALVKQLVTLHGGRVWAQSAGLGQGATFVVELPAAESANPRS